MTLLEQMLIRHEGLRLKPYEDQFGNLTIGVGRNLSGVGISRAEAIELMRNDIANIYTRLLTDKWTWVLDLGPVRRDVVISMMFNLGLRKFLTFKKAIKAMKEEDWEEAARQMLDSAWAGQVGGRARALAKMMRRGKYR